MNGSNQPTESTLPDLSFYTTKKENLIYTLKSVSLTKRKTSNMSTYILFGNFKIFTAKFFVK